MKVNPLFNKGSKRDPSNYRSLSQLPLLSRVFERVALAKTKEFLSFNNTLYEYESGFRKNVATDSCFSFLNDNFKRF